MKKFKIRFGGKGAWKKYLIGFLVLALIAGPMGLAGMFHMNNIYASYEKRGYKYGHVDGYYLGYGKGYVSGNEAGFIDGSILGYTAGYRVGVTAIDDPYHAAALAFEKNNPDMDILSMWQDLGRDNAGNPVAAISILVLYDPGVNLDADKFMDGILELLKSAYDGEKFFVIFVANYIESIRSYRMFYGFIFDAEKLLEIGWDGLAALPDNEQGKYSQILLPFPIWAPAGWISWVGNPYTSK